MIAVGIDPGATGAVAVYARDRLAETFDMPLSGKEVDAVILADRLEEIAGQCDPLYTRPQIVVVEHQQAYPGQGVSTSFQTGRRFGVVLGIVGCLDWRVEIVTAAKWKRVTGTPKDKDGARARASQLMPEAARFWTLKKHHGRAEAALLAFYGAQLLAAGRKVAA